MIEIRLAEAAHDLHDASERERLTQSLYARSMLIERPLLQALTQAALAGAADRRARPRRRALRRLPARGAGREPDHDPRVRHRARRRRRRSRSSPATARARSTTRSSAAASTTGSISRRRARARDRAPEGAGRGRAALRCRSSSSCSACARSTCSRRPASPRRSTGPTRWSRSTRSRLDPATVQDTLGVLLKYQDDIARLQGGDTAKLLDELRAQARWTERDDCPTLTRRVIAENIVHFARILRGAGMAVGPGPRARGDRGDRMRRARSGATTCTPRWPR